MRAYRADGSEIEPAELLQEYAMSIEPCEGPGFRVVELRERCESNTCDVHVKGLGGELLVGQAVRWGWPGTEISQATGYDGRVGFVMGLKSYYDPAQTPGPHWTAVAGTSDLVSGIGMIPGTVHCTVNVIFQYLDVAPEPQPEPPPQPEPGPEPEPDIDVPYTLVEGANRRLKAAGLPPIVDLRPEVKAISRLDEIPQRTFGDTTTIMAHHTGSNGPQTPMGIVKMHIEERKWPTGGYHFLVGWKESYFLCPLVWEIHDCGAHLNGEVIGIGVMGDFTNTEPSDLQVKMLRVIIEEIWQFLGGGWGKCRPTYLLPHSHLTYVKDGQPWRTACPGKLKEALIWDGQWPMLPFRREPAGE